MRHLGSFQKHRKCGLPQAPCRSHPLHVNFMFYGEFPQSFVCGYRQKRTARVVPPALCAANRVDPALCSNKAAPPTRAIASLSKCTPTPALRPMFDDGVPFNPQCILPAACHCSGVYLMWHACDDDCEKVKVVLLKVRCRSVRTEENAHWIAATAARKHEQLEDPLDMTLFLWAASTARCMHANVRFVDCPPNLFRIVGLQQLYKLHNCLIQLLNPHPIG